MIKTEKISKGENRFVYDISLDGTFINALGMNVLHNTDGFNFQLPKADYRIEPYSPTFRVPDSDSTNASETFEGSTMLCIREVGTENLEEVPLSDIVGRDNIEVLTSEGWVNVNCFVFEEA